MRGESTLEVGCVAAKSRTLAFVAALVVALSFVLVDARPAQAVTLTVNSRADPGTGGCNSTECTLREAINVSNGLPTTETITFDIPDNPNVAGLEVKTIAPRSQLPAMTDNVTIDGYTQPGAEPNDAITNANSAVLKIELNGASAGALAQGLRITGAEAAGTRIKGLVINRFGGDGVFIGENGAAQSVVEGTFIGTDPSGSLDRGNGGNGVLIESSGNLIGGPADAAQNVISGNGGDGVLVDGDAAAATDNVISNNHIGTDADAEEDLGNAANGVHVFFAPDTIVGGSSENGTLNIISGNERNGVEIDNIDATGTRVLGNFIGVNRNGNGFSNIGNTRDGVRVSSAPQNEIGGTAEGEGNTISDNGQHGVEIAGTSSTFNIVQGNLIGTNKNGSSDFGNALDGVRIGNASNTTIGGTAARARNVISGNDQNGIFISGTSSARFNGIEGNHIGTDANGTSKLGNAEAGVRIETPLNFVGRSEVGAGNLISGNTGRGVVIANGATSNSIQSNRIGTDIFGSADLGNGDAGVEIFDGSGNLIGGALSRTGNIISGNDTDGVEIDLGSNNTVQGNLIGTAQNGRSDLGNGEVGVLLRSSDNAVGGTANLARNVISGNGGTGVSMLGANASDNSVQGNLIGTQVDGTTRLANFHGVFVSAASNNTIGGTVSAAANTISGNANHGVIVVGANARGNRILRNSIFENGTPGGLGIELNNDGVTTNDNQDLDTGPNTLQNFPVLTSASTTRIEGRLNSRPGRTFTVQFFSNPTPNIPTGFGEGKTFLGQKTVTTNERGRATFSFSSSLSPGELVTATATNGGGNTSEFSQARTVG